MSNQRRDRALELVNQEKRLPFEVEAPNAESVEAMMELEQGKGKRFADSTALFKDLGL